MPHEDPGPDMPVGPDAIDADLTEDEFRSIARAIEDPQSPVGIDARRTHVLILHRLLQIERRLARLERRGEA